MANTFSKKQNLYDGVDNPNPTKDSSQIKNDGIASNYVQKSNGNINDYINKANQIKSWAQSSSTDDYYKLARDQEYSTLFDKEVALENAKANALKYTQNSINASGLGGTGYGSSLQSGIYNDYINQVNSARNTYASNIKTINQEQADAQSTLSAQSTGNLTTMLQSASDVSMMNDLLVDYGLGSVDKSGNLVWNEKPSNMSNDEWTQVRYYYNAMKNALNSTTSGVKSYNSLQSLKEGMSAVDTAKGQEGNIVDGSKWNDEFNYLGAQVDNGTVPVGSVIKLVNNGGSTIYVSYGTDGKFSLTTEDVWKQANSGHSFQYNNFGKAKNWSNY